MEEIKELHSLQLEWGCITNLMNKISDITDQIEGGWPELIDMVADAASEEGGHKDPVSAFFHLYGFLFRLYYRLKANPARRDLNKYESLDWGSFHEPVYIISDYDYHAFKWAIESGFGDRIDNNQIIIPREKLTDNQQRLFNKRCSLDKTAL